MYPPLLSSWWFYGSYWWLNRCHLIYCFFSCGSAVFHGPPGLSVSHLETIIAFVNSGVGPQLEEGWRLCRLSARGNVWVWSGISYKDYLPSLPPYPGETPRTHAHTHTHTGQYCISLCACPWINLCKVKSMGWHPCTHWQPDEGFPINETQTRRHKSVLIRATFHLYCCSPANPVRTVNPLPLKEIK